ncbi:hypothetical protein ABZ845_11770 [Streptomyces sp. NPDC047022]|uniref:hypothetical protein n=1 Tax=Streptomyces sp. NPDC047022 TaxID=3155737 RepID=UPI0034102D10
MHMYMVGAAVTAVALMVGIGVAGITTGWVPPWARRRVLRPKLTGCGALTGGIGMAMYLFLGPWGGYPSDGLRGAVAWCGWGLFMAGLLLQLLGRRPGRTH